MGPSKWLRKFDKKFTSPLSRNYGCSPLLLFRPVFGCCSLQTLVEICLFNGFQAQKLKRKKKQEICFKILAKNVFLSLHQNAGWRFFPRKNTFSVVKTCFEIQIEIKIMFIYKRSRLAKSSGFQWSWPLKTRTKWQPSYFLTIGKPNFKMFGIPTCWVFHCLVFEPPI